MVNVSETWRRQDPQGTKSVARTTHYCIDVKSRCGEITIWRSPDLALWHNARSHPGALFHGQACSISSINCCGGSLDCRDRFLAFGQFDLHFFERCPIKLTRSGEAIRLLKLFQSVASVIVYLAGFFTAE